MSPASLRTRNAIIPSLRIFSQSNRGEWLEIKGVILGHPDGSTMETDEPGMVYARTTNGQPLEVQSSIIPENFDTHVLIGRSASQPTLWQVIAARESYLAPIGQGSVRAHAEQHFWTGFDRVYIDRKQMLQLTVYASDSENFLVRLYGGTLPTPSGFCIVESTNDDTDIDISSYIPAAGAKYITLEVDTNGVVTIHDDPGVAFAAPDVATAANIPAAPVGKATLAIILLFEGMDVLLDDYIYVPADIIWNGIGGSGVWGLITGTLSDQTDLQDALDAKMAATADYSVISGNDADTDVTGVELEELTDGSETVLHTHAEAVIIHRALQLVMCSGVSSPPVPVETPDGEDWVYYEVELPP